MVFEEDCPLAQFSPDQQESLLTTIYNNNVIRSTTSASERYHLSLVLFGIRSACVIGTYRYVSTPEAAEVYALTPPVYWDDEIEPLLSEFNIPYVFDTLHSETNNEEVQVSANYYISEDDERRENLADVLSNRSPWDKLDREAHVAIGRFLDYPETVIQEWCNCDRDGGTLFDTLSDDDVLDNMGDLRTIITDIEVEPTSFVEYLLPYKVPASVDCIDEIFTDAQRFLAAGFALSLEYDIDVFSDLVAGYKYLNRMED